MRTKEHHRWARFMAVNATDNIRRMVGDKHAKFSPALSLVPRPCPTCQQIAMYRLTKAEFPEFRGFYHIWQCAECEQMGILAVLDGEEVLPMKLFDKEGNWQ